MASWQRLQNPMVSGFSFFATVMLMLVPAMASALDIVDPTQWEITDRFAETKTVGTIGRVFCGVVVRMNTHDCKTQRPSETFSDGLCLA